ncbi:hypothetical protein Mgra_00009735 [Meloidogyne graminicola]|uniref:Uncharacterized protein n=1 Tax=Meloidogyne graminicola TaxID=189291 RepID=A0A8S9Z739_9BILA|nr:hypothetical protein Mgra_00009735 [Meloidogyne graminicola]
MFVILQDQKQMKVLLPFRKYFIYFKFLMVVENAHPKHV